MVRSGAKAERWRDAHQREAASLISVGLDLASCMTVDRTGVAASLSGECFASASATVGLSFARLASAYNAASCS